MHTKRLTRTTLALALLALSGAATAQEHAHMHGAMPATPATPAPPTAPATAPDVMLDKDMPDKDMQDHAGHQAPASPAAPAAPSDQHDSMQHGQMPHSQMQHSQMQHDSTQHSQMQHDSMQHDGMAMTGAFGPYPMAREASGTSWQPDSTSVDGIHGQYGPWMTMLHGYIDTIYDRQGGPRGDSLAFSESMFMAMASRPLGAGTLGLRAMVSLDPTIGKRGYPLLFQTGETADGHTALVDRQHPHDLLMELSASYSHRLGADSAAFVYAGLPGEPALGPPAFMHRASGMDNPEAPLTHHWLDSTHITFGVVTAGYVWRDLKLEASRFNGREPDQFRWNVETRRLDSTSARLSWNPTPDWSLQMSHGRLDSPESLEPDVAVRRTTASAMVQHSLAGYPAQSTLAWGRNRHDPGNTTNGYLLESSVRLPRANTVFARFEAVQNGELFGHGAHGVHEAGDASNAAASVLEGRVFNIRKLSVGAVHDIAQVGKVKFGVGAVASAYSKPAVLDAAYGDAPSSWMVFFRAKLAM